MYHSLCRRLAETENATVSFAVFAMDLVLFTSILESLFCPLLNSLKCISEETIFPNVILLLFFTARYHLQYY